MIGDYQHRIQERAAARDVGPLPKIKKPRRRSAAKKSLLQFCQRYYKPAFFLPWAADHLTVIDQIEKSITAGGLFAFAMPRGSGKTTLCRVAAIWSILYGYRRWVIVIGSSESAAHQLVRAIKTDLTFNQDLIDDFPESVGIMAQLGGEARRAGGQLLNGKPTAAEWTATRIKFPTVPRSRASAAIISASGITGQIRGQVDSSATGEVIRPDLAVIDDPQTFESARSPDQTARRAATINADILGLAGPGRRIAGFCPCTVITAGDLAERLLSRDTSPHWHGRRMAMLNAEPADDKKWTVYKELWEDDLRRDVESNRATEFYKANQAAMDQGAEAAWPARKHDDELTAIEHAMRLKFRNEIAFYAEYQNEPKIAEAGEKTLLSAGEITRKQLAVPKGIVPGEYSYLTAGVDIQKTCLFYAVFAWRQDFTGHLVSYGIYPEQTARYPTLREITRTLQHAAPGTTYEAALTEGLDQLISKISSYKNEAGDDQPADQILVDSGYATATVNTFCRRHAITPRIMPSKGFGVTAAQSPFEDRETKRGDRSGNAWRQRLAKAGGRTRYCLIDTNYWKSFLHDRWLQPIGEAGALTIHKAEPANHQALADNMHAESRQSVSGRGRRVDEWKVKPGRPDNHWFDCSVLAAVAAAMAGASLPGVEKQARRRERKSIIELHQAAQRRRKTTTSRD